MRLYWELFGDEPAIEVHVLRRPGKDEYGRPNQVVVFCQFPPHGSGCVRIPEELPDSRPHTFNVLIDSALAGALLASDMPDPQANLPDPDYPHPEIDLVHAIAALDSPYGRLDCAIAARSRRDLMAYAGREPTPEMLGPYCVDARGLVVAPREHREWFPLPLMDFRPGVEPGAMRIPAPVKPYQ